jgi:16S rRNA (cytosine1402-N4)-methyltransferase
MAYHTPVMVREVLEHLAPRESGTYFDCTVGGGGHAEAILKASGPEGRLVGLDWDAEAIEESQNRLGAFGARVALVRASFRELGKAARRVGNLRADGILIDCGVSSRQLEQFERGFSFLAEGPLDMRMDQSQGLTAADIVNRADAKELARMFMEYGEERRARAIATAIVKEREQHLMRTTTQLATLIERVSPRRGRATHPATRVFQALRIAVNGELENLRIGLAEAAELLNPGGRLVVISFHSLEDRIVKRFFRQMSKECICPPRLPACVCGHKRTFRVLTRKPVVPSETEIQQNPRARSAKLRAVEKIAGGDQG